MLHSNFGGRRILGSGIPLRGVILGAVREVFPGGILVSPPQGKFGSLPFQSNQRIQYSPRFDKGKFKCGSRGGEFPSGSYLGSGLGSFPLGSLVFPP